MAKNPENSQTIAGFLYQKIRLIEDARVQVKVQMYENISSKFKFRLFFYHNIAISYSILIYQALKYF